MQKDYFNSFIPAIMTIFLGVNSTQVVQRLLAEDVANQSTPSTLATVLVYTDEISSDCRCHFQFVLVWLHSIDLSSDWFVWNSVVIRTGETIP